MKDYNLKETGKYAELLTLFAIILSVEYSDSKYDIWDIFVGFLIIIISLVYAQTEESKDDRLLAALISFNFALGTVIIISSLFVLFIPATTSLYHLATCTLSIVTCKFSFFILISIIITRYLLKRQSDS